MDEELLARAQSVLEKLDLDGKRREIRELEALSTHPGFWDNPQIAAKKMKKIAELQREVGEGEMLELYISERATEDLEREVGKLEFSLYLSGPYDRNDAILSLHAGQGGTEAMDWTQMLYRMYLRYIERKGWESDEIDYTPGDEAGIKSITLSVSGSFAYGFLKAEVGVHRLVRQSPFNADNLRQTSFAMVEVLPILDEGADIEIKDEDLQWDFYRAGGKGGQNVNKVSTAVRLTHIPTGIIVASQAQRYQGQNREYALKILQSKLWTMREQEAKDAQSKIKGVYKTPGWGNQIRSYVLHPYHMVKDLRTQFETGNTDRVLDGDIEDFIVAYLKKSS